MVCLGCGANAEVGALCGRCALEVVPCDGLISDHLRSATDPTVAAAWVVDGFGVAHAVAERTRFGRNHDGDFVVLASSVSREHAELALGEAGWTVRDLGSRNGTFVNGARCTGEVGLSGRAVLAIGDVALWFLAEVVDEPPRRPTIPTGDARGGLVHYRLVHGATELGIVAGSDATSAGALLWRAVGTELWSERGLAPLEFQLVRALCARAYEEAASPLAIRGCVPTKELVRELPFLSKFANQENVRQIVLRVRNLLGELGAAGLLAVAPGRGYYLACNVTAAGVGAGASR